MWCIGQPLPLVPRLDFSIQETTKQMQSNTADVAIRAQRRSANGLYPDWTKPVAVARAASPGYYNGAGSDRVTYRIPANVAALVKSVRAVVHYQSIPPYYLQDRFEIGKINPSTSVLLALLELVDYSNTAAKGWKLPVAQASAGIN
jgi:hypothetical protein